MIILQINVSIFLINMSFKWTIVRLFVDRRFSNPKVGLVTLRWHMIRSSQLPFSYKQLWFHSGKNRLRIQLHNCIVFLSLDACMIMSWGRKWHLLGDKVRILSHSTFYLHHYVQMIQLPPAMHDNVSSLWETWSWTKICTFYAVLDLRQKWTFRLSPTRSTGLRL